jgi:xanthine dehydrogenase accessory factor
VNSLNFEVIASVCEWLEQDNHVFFVTVLNTWGASPRPVGSLFVYNVDKNLQVGSLSGGCIEADLVVQLDEIYSDSCLRKSQSIEEKNTYSLKRYGDENGDSDRYLLPCGGILELLIEPLFGNLDHKHFLELKQNLSAHKRIARVIKFQTEQKSRLVLLDEQVSSSSNTLSFNKIEEELYHRLDPSYQLLIIGAGDVTAYLADIAKTLEFKVTICEPRQEYLRRLKLAADDVDLQACLPDDLIRSGFLSEYTAIACLAHDPKVDDMALLEALVHSESFYIGAMGSLKTTEKRKERLKSLGLNNKQLLRLKAPIGIDIHSKTPQEIAIAIMAELISARHFHKHNSQTA